MDWELGRQKTAVQLLQTFVVRKLGLPTMYVAVEKQERKVFPELVLF